MTSNPTSCTGQPLRNLVRVTSWQQPGVVHEASYDRDENGRPLVVEGCDNVPFGASIAAQPTTAAAESPSGLDVSVRIPQNEDPKGLSTATLKDVEVTLPEGMTVNPSSAGGLASCSAAQANLDGEAPASCPAASKIGSVEVDTPLLSQPLHGSVHLAQQRQNKFGSLLAMYMTIDDPVQGIVMKLAGKVEADPASGRLVAGFDRNPQFPFEQMQVKLFGGPRASLITPARCGTYTTSARFTPWSETSPVSSTDDFSIVTGPDGKPCPNGEFGPRLSAGTINPAAGEFSPFTFQLSRADGSQRFAGIETTLPRGLLAKLAGVPYCPEAALAAIPAAEGTAAAQVAAPSCPAASQVGRVAVSAGAGTSPFNLETGRAYLAGPYKGAPLSLAVVTPALAGPFDLGNVVVRVALHVDRESTQVRAVSDPLPTILYGIPLDLRTIQLDLDRGGFTLNPTSCARKEVSATIASTGGASAQASVPFQADACPALGFTPKLDLSLKGGTKRGAYPALTAKLRARKGDANIERAVVTLPRSEFLAQEHIKTVCTRVQFNAGNCPKGSVYGTAEAHSLLLDKPLKGPVYLRANGGERELPDLVADLNGQIDVDLVGYIDSIDGGIRTRFQGVPDAPVSSFTLRMKGGKKSLLVNSRNLCAGVNRAKVKMTAHNGKLHTPSPALGVSCGRKK